MSKCIRVESCSFFYEKRQKMPGIAALFKQTYCENDHSKCARNYLFTYLEKKEFSVDDKTEDFFSELLDTLYPNQFDEVKRDLPDLGSE